LLYVKATRNTWASKCTSFLAFSTETDPTIPSISLPHIGHESYRNMWHKSRAIWNYIALHYVNDYDWFLMGGDDMYYIMENLHEYLSSDELQTAHSIRQEGNNSRIKYMMHYLYFLCSVVFG
jgi:glycoprotein-N-acetylgalactosamine 3-beta-galactosyltransferase